MIHYALRCDSAHEFDGWFKDSAAFDQQAKRGLLDCPVCGSASVERALMAPAVSTRKRREVAAPAPAAPTSPPSGAPAVAMDQARLPDHVRAVLQKMRAEVEKHCDYVGPAFADEARKMHRGEIDPRAIYGETTQEQAELLTDEGIEVARIPWVPRADG